MMQTGKTFEINGLGVFTPSPIEKDELTVGDVGFLTASIKNVGDSRVGDTITLANNPAAEPLPGYKKMNPMVFCGLYPVDADKYNDLREALERLELNDSSLQYEAETSQALGLGSVVGSLDFYTWKLSKKELNENLTLT